MRSCQVYFSIFPNWFAASVLSPGISGHAQSARRDGRGRLADVLTLFDLVQDIEDE